MNKYKNNNQYYVNGVVINTLKEVNSNKLCRSYFGEVLQSRRGFGNDVCKRINGDCCRSLCGNNLILFTFWDCLAARDKVTSKIEREGSNEVFNNIIIKSTEGLTDIIKTVYKSIVDRYNHSDSVLNIKLTVDNDEDYIVNTIVKYYEVSHNWKPDHPNDNVTLPIYTISSDGKSTIDYQYHYIARDIARIYGKCRNGEDCIHNEKCRDSIHFTVQAKDREVLYCIDDHIESFRKFIKQASKTINEDRIRVVSESINQVSNTSQKSPINVSTEDGSISSSYKDAVSRPQTPITNSYQNKAKENNVNYWTNYWLLGKDHIEQLFHSLDLHTTEMPEILKLIRRILWKSLKIVPNRNDINEDYVIKMWKKYQDYKEGTSYVNSEGISFRSATSVEHLSADFKSGDDSERQKFNKNCRKNSSRYNYYEDYSESQAGDWVFDLDSINNMEHMYLDCMSEFLDITIFKDNEFLIAAKFETKPLPSSLVEDYKWLDKDFRDNMISGLESGNLARKLFNDSNLINSYKDMLFETKRKGEPFNNFLYGGTWIKKMYSCFPKDFLCIMFYFVNKDNKEYKGININMCKKQYCYYNNSLPSLKNPQSIKLFTQGIDSVFVEALPVNWSNGKIYTREEYLELLVDYLINYALTLQLKEYAPNEVLDYKNSIKEASSEVEVWSSQNKIRGKLLEMQDKNGETSKLEDLKNLVFEHTIEQLDNEKEWTVPHLKREGKRTSEITIKYVTDLISLKLGLSTDSRSPVKINRISSVSPVFKEGMKAIDQERARIDSKQKFFSIQKSRLRQDTNLEQDLRDKRYDDINNKTFDLYRERQNLDNMELKCKNQEIDLSIGSLTKVLHDSVNSVISTEGDRKKKKNIITRAVIEGEIFSRK